MQPHEGHRQVTGLVRNSAESKENLPEKGRVWRKYFKGRRQVGSEDKWCVSPKNLM